MTEVSGPAALARRLKAEVGIADSYSYELAHGTRTPSDKLAVKIFRRTGVKLGPVASLSDDDIDTLARLKGLEEPQGAAA